VHLRGPGEGLPSSITRDLAAKFFNNLEAYFAKAEGRARISAKAEGRARSVSYSILLAILIRAEGA